MNKENARTIAYGSIIGLFVVLVVAGFVAKAYRLQLLLTAFSVLGIGYAIERSFRQKLTKPLKSGGQWFNLGFLESPGFLLIGDAIDMSNSARISDLPHGRLQVEVERFAKGSEHYVAAVRLSGGPVDRDFRQKEIQIPVDTGFVIFLARDPCPALRGLIKEAQSRVLSENRELDAEVVLDSGQPIGVVASSGLGDGQYAIQVQENERQELEIVCRFLDNLNEV